MITSPAGMGTTGFLNENVAGALAYATILPAIVFLRVMPFRRNHFVRFHSFQSIFFALAAVVVGIAMRALFSILGLIPWLGYLLAWLAVLLVSLAWGILWLVVVVKALQGELFKLPVIGDLAERQ
jgi:uncharacterized membrane protein